MPLLHPKTRTEWLNIRRGFVSSTESAALFGMSPYLTAFELAVEKKTTEPPDDWEGNERTQWGLRLQRVIAEAVAAEYGVKVRALTAYATHATARIGASFDYEIVGVKDEFSGEDTRLRDYYTAEGPGVLEIKNVDRFVFSDEWEKNGTDYDAPAHIELQLQHQLECVNREWGCLAALVGGNRQVIVLRLRDTEVGKVICDKVERFYALIDRGGMPAINLPEDADAVRRLYCLAEPGTVRDYQEADDEEIHALARAHALATAAKSAAEEAHKISGTKLIMAIGTAEKVLFDDMTVSAGTVGPTTVAAYERKGYRNLRVTVKKPKKEKTA